MENSVKAIYIAAGMLLGVMILSVWVYLFRQGASLGQNYEADRNTERIVAFNSQFDKYTNITNQWKDSEHGYAFDTKGNLPSDVITCANLAYTINRKNDYDIENHVEVEVKLGGGKSYNVFSEEIQPKDFFVLPSRSKATDFNSFLQYYSKVKIVNINSNKYKSSGESIYEYYFDVGADGLEYSEVTGKIKKIIFNCVETEEFNTNGNGYWSENL